MTFQYRTMIRISVLLTALLLQQCGKSMAETPKNFFLVLDTSGSMGRNEMLIEKVKKSVPLLLEKAVKAGDRVMLMTFDDELLSLGEYQVQSDKDKARIVAEIEKIASRDKSTDMWGMVLGLKEISANYEKDKREQFIIILSDGQDSPSPRKRKELVSLEKFKSPTPGPVQEKFIYYISLKNQKNQEVIKSLQKSIPSKVIKVVSKTGDDKGAVRVAGKTGADGKTGAAGKTGADGKTGAAGKTGADGKTGKKSDLDIGISEVIKDIRKNRFLSLLGNIWPFLAAGFLLLLLIAVALIVLRNHRNRNKLEGYIIFYEDGIKYPTKSAYRLDRLNSNQFTVGSRYGVNLRVKQLGLPQDFRFRCKKEKNVSYLAPLGKSASLIQYQSQSRPGLISYGDLFKIGNYLFEYSEGRE